MSEQFVLPKQAPIADSGAPRAGAKAYFYQAGTLTAQSVYQDAACTLVHANPVVADDAGHFAPIYKNPAATGDYRLILRTSEGTLVYDIDNIPKTSYTASQLGQVLQGTTSAETLASVAPTSYAYPPGDLRRYGADPTGVADSSNALASAASQSLQPGGSPVLVCAGTYRIASNTTLAAASSLHVLAGGLLSVDAAVTLTINGSYRLPDQQCFTGSGSFSFEDQPGKTSVIYPDWWGAKGDTSVDSYAAITKAIASAPVGARIQLFGGTYKLTAGITFTQSCEFAGINRTATALYYTGTGGDIVTVTDDEIDVYIHDLSIDNAGTAANGMKLKGIHTWVERVKIWPNTGFSNTAITTRPNGGAGSQVLDIKLKDIYVIGTPRSGVGSVTAVGIECPWVVNLVFDQVWVENCAVGVRLGETTQQVAGADIRGLYINAFHSAGTSAVGLHVKNCQSFSVTGALIEMCADSNAADTGHRAVVIDKCESGFIGNGCDFWGNGQGTHAISVSSANAKNVHFDGITFTSWATAGFSISNGTRLKFGHNALNGTAIMYDPGTVATIVSGALTPITYPLCRVQGEGAANDDLDSIANGVIGDIITLMAHSSSVTVTVKDGTNIKCAGDFALDNIEDSITLIYTGTYWQEIARSDNGA